MVRRCIAAASCIISLLLLLAFAAPTGAAVDGLGRHCAAWWQYFQSHRGYPVRVVLVGDSIFGGGQSPPRAGPVGMLLPLKLGRRYSVVNLACAGSTTGHWVPSSQASCPRCYDGPPFVNRLVPALPAAWVVVLLGTNDSGYYRPPRLAADVGARYFAIADAAIRHGARRVMLVVPPPRPPGAPGGERRHVLRAYRDEIFKLCDERRQIVCGPDLLTLMDGTADFKHGNVHPNGMGHEKMAQLVADAILSHGGRNGWLGTD